MVKLKAKEALLSIPGKNKHKLTVHHIQLLQDAAAQTPSTARGFAESPAPSSTEDAVVGEQEDLILSWLRNYIKTSTSYFPGRDLPPAGLHTDRGWS